MAFDEQTRSAVWRKGQTVTGYDPSKCRKDECGAWMIYGHYGNTDSDYGWEIDHISPGGPDVLSNLRPLQWANNRAKSDGRLKCVVTSQGNGNTRVGTRAW